jgi:hypothetical protein
MLYIVRFIYVLWAKCKVFGFSRQVVQLVTTLLSGVNATASNIIEEAYYWSDCRE